MRAISKWPELVAIVSIVGGVHVAAAQAPDDGAREARLIYVDATQATQCPSEQAIADGVRERLGEDPFTPSATFLLIVDVTEEPSALRAQIELREPGRERAYRVLTAPAGDCTELAESVVLALSIAIDPVRAFRGPAPEPEAPRPEPAAVEETSAIAPPVEPPAPAVEPAAEDPVALDVVVAAGASFESAPLAVPLVRAGVELAWRALRVGAGARFELPAEVAYGGGVVRAAPSGGEIWACADVAPLFGCGLALVGATIGSSAGLPGARTEASLYVALGGRFGAALAIDSVVSLTISVDVVAPLLRAHLVVDDAVVWTTPPVSVAPALGIVVRCP